MGYFTHTSSSSTVHPLKVPQRSFRQGRVRPAVRADATIGRAVCCLQCSADTAPKAAKTSWVDPIPCPTAPPALLAQSLIRSSMRKTAVLLRAA